MATQTKRAPIDVLGTSGPRGDRPPRRPDLPLILLRLVWVVCLLVVLARGPLLALADLVPAPAAPLHTSPALPQAATRDPWAWVGPTARMTRQAFTSRWMQLPETVVLLGLGILGLELAANAVLLVMHTRGQRRAQTIYGRIRTPQPLLAGRATGTSAPSAEDMYHLLHRLLPWTGGYGGGTHWLALTLSTVPDEPVDLGIAISGGSAEDRASRLATVRKMVAGFDASAVLDDTPDPLPVAATPGRVVLWREYTLVHTPAYPLRLPDDAQTDLLAPLLAALRGRRGAAYTEYHLTLRPRNDFDLTNGWRVYALRRLLQLRAKHHYSMNPDMDALQTKIDNPAYDLTVRVIVIAADRASVPVAQTELDEIERVLLAQFQARSGTFLQRFAVRARCRLPLTPVVIAGASRMQRRIVAGLGLLLGALVAGGWHMAGARLWMPPAALWAQPARVVALLIPWLWIVLAVLLPVWMHGRWSGALVQSRWQRLRARAPRATPTASVMLPVRAWRMPSVVSTIELSGLWHLPTPGMGALVRWLPSRVLPVPPAAFVPQAAAPQAVVPAHADAAPPRRRWWHRAPVTPQSGDDGTPPTSGHALPHRRWWHWRAAAATAAVPPPSTATTPEPWVTLGHARRTDGSRAPVGMPLRRLRKILHITAGMGAGKTRLLSNLCQQLMPVGFILGDGKGDDDQGSLVATVQQLVPLEDEGRLAILDVLDTDWPVGINPISGIDMTRPGGADMALGQVLAIFARLDPDVWGKSMGMQQFIRTGALLVFEAEPQPTMAHIKQALVDQTYRDRLLKRCTNIEVRSYWTVTFPNTSDQQKTSLDALLRRFDNLLLTETTRYLLTQPQATFDLRQAMDDQMIVLVPLPDMTLGGMAGLVGMLIIQAMVRAAFGRQGSDQSRVTYPMILDEFQVFLTAGASEDVSTAITRLRSLGIASIYAHQSLKQLGELVDVMLINAASRVIMKTGEPDSSVYARQYAASGLTAQDIANQDAAAHQYAVLDADGQTVGPISLEPLPWPEVLRIDLPPWTGEPWQHVFPDPVEAADALLCQIAYGDFGAMHFQRLIGGLAQLPPDAWAYVNARWDTLAACQRASIFQHPSCVENRWDRQQWCSRLGYARPRALVAAQYQRQRWLVAPGSAPARVAPKGRIGKGGSFASSASDDPTRDWRYGSQTPPTAVEVR